MDGHLNGTEAIAHKNICMLNDYLLDELLMTGSDGSVEGMFQIGRLAENSGQQQDVICNRLHDDIIHDDWPPDCNFCILDHHVLDDVDELVIDLQNGKVTF